MSSLSPITKCLLYPIVIAFLLVFYALVDYSLTLFFAWLFEATLISTATFPLMVVLYVCSAVGAFASILTSCEYIEKEF